MATKAQFDQAVSRLLGAEKFKALFDSGYSRPDFCREVSQDYFIDALQDSPFKEEDVDLVRNVAFRLWMGDGTTGLLDYDPAPAGIPDNFILRAVDFNGYNIGLYTFSAGDKHYWLPPEEAVKERPNLSLGFIKEA